MTAREWIEQVTAKELEEHTWLLEEVDDFEKDGSNYKNRAWDFSRRLLMHPEVRLTRSTRGPDSIVEVVVEYLHSRGFELPEGAEAALWKALDHAEVPEDPLAAARDMVAVQPLYFDCACRLASFQWFAAFCYHLQCMWGDNDMPLAEVAIARTLGRPQSTISHWRCIAERCGLLKKVARECHYPEGGKKGLAAEFRFVGKPIILSPSLRKRKQQDGGR